MPKILANDGLAPSAVSRLNEAGFEVDTEKVPQDELATAINENNYVGILVRSATTVRKDLIDACSGLKLIGRAGVGMDNIDVDYARDKGIHVVNTPAASSQSVAELVMGHLFSISRFLHESYAVMPEKGADEFAKLKKSFAKGTELRGKTIGIIGLGRIGRYTASYAAGIGMKVIAYDPMIKDANATLDVEIGAQKVQVHIPVVDLPDLYAESDYISLHVPKQKDGAIINDKAISLMKDGVRIVNAARGGVIDEDALLSGLESGKVAFAALDVFENEPTPRKDLLTHSRIATTPHIGAATVEAQDRIGLELADQIIDLVK